MIQILKAVVLCRVHRPGKDLQDYIQEANCSSASHNSVNLFLFLAGTHMFRNTPQLFRNSDTWLKYYFEHVFWQCYLVTNEVYY